MAYLAITDFKIGMDRRRARSAGTPGSLWTLKNAHITRGGDIESVKQFVPYFDLPAGTFGAAQVRGQIHVFGSADIGSTMPRGVQYQRLQNGSAVMTRIYDVKPFQTKLYAIAAFDDGNIYHYFDGTRISEWDTVADANASLENLADFLADLINNESGVDAIAFGTKITITARAAGTPFTISRSVVDGGSSNDQDIVLSQVQANVAPADAVSASGSVTITGGSFNPTVNRIISVKVDDQELLTEPVDWATSNEATAAALAAAITAGTDAHTYSASAVGAVVTITAGINTGTTGNGKIVSTVNGGDVTTSTANLSGGADAIEAVKQIYTADFTGTMEVLDKFTLTIDGTAYSATPRAAATGTALFVSHQRVFSPAADVLRYSKLGDATDWTDSATSSGAGFIDIGSNAEGAGRVIAAAAYSNQMAVFSRDVISLYALDTDAENIIFIKPVGNSGTPASRSPIGYGDNDLFYLDFSGVRSLRARAGTSDAYVDDVGSPLDDFIISHMASLPRARSAAAVSAIEPTDKRLLLALDNRIYVLSHFPNNKITAWGYYEEPDRVYTDFVRTRNRLYARSGNIIYLYGGEDGSTYPGSTDQDILVELPFMSANTPATDKSFKGFDIALTNTWEVAVLPNPANENEEIVIGGVAGTSYGKPNIPLPGETSLFALRLTCQAADRASISSLAVHYVPEKNPQ